MPDDLDQLNDVLRHLDHPAPRIDAATIIAVARAREQRVVRLRWAAGAVLALGLASAAYATPGLPVKRWVQSLVHRGGEAPLQTPPPAVGGIAVAPGGSLIILFTAEQADGWARVSLTDGADVVVHAPSGAATFTSEVERLVIDNRAVPDTFEIQIPRAAPRVEILVAGTRIFLKEGAGVTPRCHDSPCRLLLP